MPSNPARKRIYYSCRYCGQKVIRTGTQGPPMPQLCARNPKGPNKGPHSWSRYMTTTI